MARNNNGTCGALWYFGDGDDRTKHVCHRRRRHLGGHHSDGGLSWARDPHHRRAKIDLHEPCSDCEPVGVSRR
jgi:hypothetical protein